MDNQKIEIGTVILNWSEWHSWSDLKEGKEGVNSKCMPNKKSGVYEVKHSTSSGKLHIGRASDLKCRILSGLIKGLMPHSAGEKIRNEEDITSIVVRWAETNRPAAVEEALHLKYKREYKKLPKYVSHT